jgi:hypothetical protein
MLSACFNVRKGEAAVPAPVSLPRVLTTTAESPRDAGAPEHALTKSGKNAAQWRRDGTPEMVDGAEKLQPGPQARISGIVLVWPQLSQVSTGNFRMRQTSCHDEHRRADDCSATARRFTWNRTPY